MFKYGKIITKHHFTTFYDVCSLQKRENDSFGVMLIFTETVQHHFFDIFDQLWVHRQETITGNAKSRAL